MDPWLVRGEHRGAGDWNGWHPQVTGGIPMHAPTGKRHSREMAAGHYASRA